jgi:hypothetical protein
MARRITDLDQLTEQRRHAVVRRMGRHPQWRQPLSVVCGSLEGCQAARPDCHSHHQFAAAGRQGVIRQFETIGVDPECWDDIVTSGDVTRQLVSEGPQQIYFLGPERDIALVDGLDVELVEPDAAKAVLCTGLFDDETEQAEELPEPA